METLNKEARQRVMKDIILKLHEGLSAEAAKERFEKEVGNVTSSEIAEIEQGLIDESLSPEELKKFCNVHALIFQSALEKAAVQETSPSHPVYLFKLENREIEKVVDSLKKAAEKGKTGALPALKKELQNLLLKLRGIEKHYERKEQLLFPFLEKKGFMGPSKVMWGKDNEIRDMLKKALKGLDEIDSPGRFAAYKKDTLDPLAEEVPGMIFKEENILFPTSLEKLDAADWVEILRESGDIGYVFIETPAETTGTGACEWKLSVVSAGDYVVWLIENPLGEEITVELRKFHEKGRPGNGKKLSFQGSNKRRVPSKYTVPALAQIPDDITPANTALIVKYTVRVTSNSGSHDTDPELQVDPPPDSMLGRLRPAPLVHVAPSQR